MKNFEHPEYFILTELQLLQKKYPDMAELAELTDRVKRIINENNLAIVKHAMLYTVLGEDELFPATEDKLRRLYRNAFNALDEKQKEKK